MNLRGLECGAGGRNRTGTGLTPRDFESRASTNFTTPAPLKTVQLLRCAVFFCILNLNLLAWFNSRLNSSESSNRHFFDTQ